MNAERLLSIGECLMELSPTDQGLLKPAYAGDTFNTAWYARELLPAEFTVDYLTAVGNDQLSASLLAFMHEANIGIGHVKIVPNRQLGLYLIQVDEYGERNFFYWREASAARKLAEDPDNLRAAIEKAGIIHFSGITLAILPPEGRETLLAELRRAKAAGAVICFDPNIRPALWESRQVMREICTEAARAANIALPGLDEEQEHFGTPRAEEVIARYLGLGVDMVLLKRGAQGALLHFAGKAVPIPAAPAPWVVDTTAAGDSFAGAFIARLMQGETPERSARKAAIVAAEVIGHRGALAKLSMRVGEEGER
jgi:2-dehydro-3-deoxygluconokinase